MIGQLVICVNLVQFYSSVFGIQDKHVEFQCKIEQVYELDINDTKYLDVDCTKFMQYYMPSKKGQLEHGKLTTDQNFNSFKRKAVLNKDCFLVD